MDEHTLEKLEYDRIRQLLAQHAQCALGRDLAMHIRPSRRASQITMWLEQGRQFARWVAIHGLPPFAGIRDVREQVRRAVPPAKLEPEEFADLAATLEGIGLLREYLQSKIPTSVGSAGRADLPSRPAVPSTNAEPTSTANSSDQVTTGSVDRPPDPASTLPPNPPAEPADPFGLVTKLGTRLGDFQTIVNRIRQAIDQRGKVRDDASERLARLRQEIEETRRKTREVFDGLLRQQAIVKLLQYPNATFHDDRMVLPLKAEQHGRLPGIVHRSSDSGQTLFVEPAEAVELNNTRINLLQAEQEEIGRILWELTHLVHLNQKEMLQTLETVAVLDLLTAKYKFGLRYHMHLPVISERVLKFHKARNPILMAAYEDEAKRVREHPPADGGLPANRVVPIDVRLGDDFDVMMITGPNTGGKTAALKTVGLLVLMAQSGLPIPVGPGSQCPIFTEVWIDVGDEQSLQQSLSTFSAHLARILAVLQHARKSTLVLFDELGAGTDPEEGAAIGRAIVERLLECGCLAMVTTHLGALKALGYEIDRVDNAAVQFDVQTLRPIYELCIGEPGNSNAITIAARLGMPRRLVMAARRHLSGGPRALDRAIAGTFRVRREAERARHDAEKARQDAARETLAALDRAKALERERETYTQWVQRIINLRPGAPVRVRNFDDLGRVVRVRLDKQLAAVAVGSIELEVAFTDLIFPE